MRLGSEALHQRGCQPGLADARFTGQKDNLTFAALRFRSAPQQQFEFFLASDEFGHATCVESLIRRLCQRQKAWCATPTTRTKRGRLFTSLTSSNPCRRSANSASRAIYRPMPVLRIKAEIAACVAQPAASSRQGGPAIACFAEHRGSTLAWQF